MNKIHSFNQPAEKTSDVHTSNMISSSHEATPSLLDSFHGRDLTFHGHKNKYSSHNPTDKATMRTDMNCNPKTNAPTIAKMTIKKERSRRPHGHSSSPIRKTKYPTNHKLIPAIPHTISSNHISGRVSPRMIQAASSEYRGKMWIRPRNSDPKKQFEYCSKSAQTMNQSPVNQVPVSPILNDEDEMLMYSACSSDDSYDWHRTNKTGQKKIRIVFGESGKPIKIRSIVDITI